MKVKIEKINNKTKLYIFFRTIMDTDWLCWESDNFKVTLELFLEQRDNIFITETYLVTEDCVEQFLIDKNIDKNSKVEITEQITAISPEEYVKKRRKGK